MASTAAGVLARNVVGFARGLRRAGLPIGTGRVRDALHALTLLDVSRRDELYWGLASVLIDRHAQMEVYDAAFRLFWEQMPFMTSSPRPREGGDAPAPAQDHGEELAQRVAQAFAVTPQDARSPRTEDDAGARGDATHTASWRERLGRLDFQSMSIEQLREARHMLAQLRLPIAPVRTRRSRPHPRGARVDLRATLRASLRGQSDLLPLRRRAPRLRQPPLVVLCDISGSMHRYAQMLLHFLHALTGTRERMQVFVFGTRLTNITRALRQRDVDAALAAVARGVTDWGGGTRIGTCLHDFNQHWSRRVLGQNAVVLLISDGLERDRIDVLSQAMERLHKSCSRLIWLNPLLRYERFQPLAQGIRAMRPHVDEFRAAHSIESLMDLVRVLGNSPSPVSLF